MFFDEVQIHVEAGAGGDGCVSFRREKYVPLGGPNGGNGGRGGDVYLEADPHLNTLISFKGRRHFKAQRGGHGKGKNMQGPKGDDVSLSVPPGTVVRDAETGELLADLMAPGQKALVARGGRGGLGNAAFASPTNQAPRIAERGDPGESRRLILELKLIADVGIVGCPNAGKSTLLAAVSAARPKIADYPFTTLVPNLGMVGVDDRDFVMVDIPGLIEGAHKGTGLGHEFLRHIERTRVLIHLLDGAAKDPLQDLDDINEELRLFNSQLASKPQLVVLNKMDLPQAQELWPLVKEEVARTGTPVCSISAATGSGVREMLYLVLQLLDSLPEEEIALEEAAIFRPPEDDDGFSISAEEVGFRIKGKRVERLVARTDWRHEESIRRLHRALERLGVAKAMEEAGVRKGDTVYIGDSELEWS
ncbi:MAG: GTPase ObgE [Chloroflexi bacterium B3_Chlor]|nr:MAG: GTPase ObgE [Chloroflexi bacterium B3_Chlor]